MMRVPAYTEVDELRLHHAAKRKDIRRRLAEFAAVPGTDYFYELAYCLLTPQSSALNAGKAIEALKKADLLGADIDPARILFSKAHYIRFHNTKARRLTEAKKMLPEIRSRLENSPSAEEVRAWLVGNVNGLGWKEASHFLRNVGRRDLAILDRHVLRNLKRHGVIRALPKTLTPSRYLAIERRFRRFAEWIGVPMDELDLVFWSRETGEILK